MSRKNEAGETAMCPYCGTSIYVEFVRNNEQCPVSSCSKPLKADELVPEPQMSITKPTTASRLVSN